MASSVDPARELEFILLYSGVTRPADRPSAIYPYIVGFTYLNLIADFFTTTIYIVERHPFDDKIEAIQCAISFIHLVGKIWNLKVRSDIFWRLINSARDLWRELAQDKENEEILNNESIFLKKAQSAIMVLALWPVPLSIILTTMRNLSLEPEKRELVYQNWDPIRDTLGEDWYWTRCTYEVTIMFYALYLFVAVYFAIFVPCLIAAAQMKVLKRMLESDRLDVRACVTLHQRILKFIADMNKLFAGQMFLDMILSALYISFRSYQLIQMVNNNDPRAFGTFFFLSICFGGPFIVCLSGHIITDMCEEVYRSSNFGPWYNLSEKERKAMCFLMRRAADVPTLNYRNFMKFNMSQYGAMVQATYSYITLLTGK